MILKPAKSKVMSAVMEVLESRTLMSAAPKVMGYLVDYQIGGGSTGFNENSGGAITNDNLDWKDLKQVNYFSLEPEATPAYNSANPVTTSQGTTSNGSLQAKTSSGYDPAVQLPKLVSDAKSHGVSVYVTIGGGDGGSIYDMDALVNSSSSVWGTFASNLQSFVTKYGLSGVDLDWEPTAQGGFTVTKTQLDNYGNMIKTIKADEPNLALTADALGDPITISNANGSGTGKTAYMLNAVAVQNLSAVNVEAYPGVTESQANTIMGDWKSYLSGGTDLDGTKLSASVSKLQYGIDVADDSSNSPSGVIEAKVDLTVKDGFGGVFLWEADASSANSALGRIGAEITKDTGGSSTGGNVSGTVDSTKGAGVSGITVYLDVNNNGTLDSGELSTMTSSTGAYGFSSVPAGAYIVRQKLPSGDTQTSPSGGYGIHVTVTNGGSFTGENFTDSVPATAAGSSVSGSVKTSKGAGVANVTVYLDSNNDGKLNNGELSAVTNSSGAFTVSNVPAGAYIVRQVLPSGDTQTTPSGGYGIHVTVSKGSNLSGENFVDTVATTTGPAELTGKLLGSTNALSHAASGHPASNVFDNSVGTVFEDTYPSSVWVGLDLGKSYKITQIKFAADPANPSFMEGGIFQGSDVADFSSGDVNLYQVPNTSTPSTSLTTVNISNTMSFRYVRYLPPAGSYGDVAEVDFYGTPA
ncbi:MAG TPA: carboxypeptidase regulatory-like domain-containing protein [Tepidisphaeraceae bacterium]|nr:carboxypeptidase regulatory-like domain-containing protein [Tepidisphaeraceae bacterium]